ncbi:MAG: OmpA family protein [Pirellulaceae bacterium]
MTPASPAPLTINPMLARFLCWLSLVVGLLCVSGCRNPYAPPGPSWQPGVQAPAGYPLPQMSANDPNAAFGQTALGSQIAELQRRNQQLDDNNRQLTTQLAQAQQQAQAFRERADLVAKQLGDLSNQNRQLLAATQQYANQTRGMQASMNSRGGATLTANNSVANSAVGLQIAGARVVPDGDVLRVRVPADQLFAPGTAQLSPSAAQILDQLSSTITRQFPRQRVAVEGHSDTAQPYGSGFGTPYQLAVGQAQAVMDQLVRRGGVPMQQLFVVAHGPNHPIADNQTPAGRAENRRIEVVIYPETY